MGNHDVLTISHTLADLRVWDCSVSSLSKTNVTIGCHLVNLALEEILVVFHSTIFSLSIMSKLFCTRIIKWFDVAVRGGLAAVIVFLHESFLFIGSRNAPVVPKE